MILALFILGCLFVFATLCGLLVIGYRARAHSAEARANRAEGALGEAQERADGMTEIAREAIKISAKAAKLNPDEVLPRKQSDYPPNYFGNINATMPAYTSQLVANCPTCSVSVRHPPEMYPVKCPRVGCGTLIDPVFDDPDLRIN